MWLPVIAVIGGLLTLIWSADRFVSGAASTAYRLGMSTLLVGMVIVGFGTSAPEMVVSVLASYQGNPGLALGNAIGSNISNIALILGITAIVSPILVHSNIVKRELPILAAVSLLLVFLLRNSLLTRMDGAILLIAFALVMGWSIFTATRQGSDVLKGEFDTNLDQPEMTLGKSVFWLVLGMILLIVSSRVLVWGAVEIAVALGVSDLIVGLTVVAIGTSLPELASSIAATRKGEHDIAIGNVIGSNLFNTLGVIGLAGVIHPLDVDKALFYRDLPVMGLLTLFLFFTCLKGRGAQGKVVRWEGVMLVMVYIGYTTWVVINAVQQSAVVG